MSHQPTLFAKCQACGRPYFDHPYQFSTQKDSYPKGLWAFLLFVFGMQVIFDVCLWTWR